MCKWISKEGFSLDGPNKITPDESAARYRLCDIWRGGQEPFECNSSSASLPNTAAQPIIGDKTRLLYLRWSCILLQAVHGWMSGIEISEVFPPVALLVRWLSSARSLPAINRSQSPVIGLNLCSRSAVFSVKPCIMYLMETKNHRLSTAVCCAGLFI